MHIIVYTKTGCPWGIDAVRYLKEKGLSYEERNMSLNEAYKKEAIEKSGVFKCPTFDVDGTILGDSSAEELDTFIKSK